MLSGWAGQFPLRQGISEASRLGCGEPGTEDSSLVFRYDGSSAANQLRMTAAHAKLCVAPLVLSAELHINKRPWTGWGRSTCTSSHCRRFALSTGQTSSEGHAARFV